MKKNPLMENAKNTIGLGIGSMAGMSALGAMGSIKGMPAGAANIAGIASSGLALANVGQLVKTTQSIVPNVSGRDKLGYKKATVAKLKYKW